jgi:N-acetylglucosaminyldiphosphoundecaprenol N-acetyl-beta-D-mannosaminyltransferase
VSPLPRVEVLGVPVSVVDIGRALDRIAHWVTSRDKRYVCVTGVHGVMESQRDSVVMTAHRSAGMVVPDGMPLVWCARAVGMADVGHVRGADLMHAILERSVAEGWRHYFYGSSDEVLAALVAKVTATYQDIQIVGAMSPPFRALSAEEGLEIASEINHLNPDIVWVGLSTPKQELWMFRWRKALVAPVMIGVGAAFDFHAGTRRQAPPWLRDTGLEWLYRLVLEPRRLWRRYLINNTEFVAAILKCPPRVTTSPGPM